MLQSSVDSRQSSVTGTFLDLLKTDDRWLATRVIIRTGEEQAVNRAASPITQTTQRWRTATCATGLMSRDGILTLRLSVFALDRLPLKELV